MATVVKCEKRKGGTWDIYRYRVEGLIYRVQIVAYDYLGDEENVYDEQFMAWVLHQSYHKNSSYRQCGELIYRGISLKECWEEAESWVGENVSIPEELKQLQPFIAQQT